MSTDDDADLPRSLLRRLLIFGLVVAVLVGGAAVYLEGKGHAPEELAEMMGEGGEKVLRDPLHAARGAPRVIVFALDGVGDGELRQALASGGMPRVAALLGRE